MNIKYPEVPSSYFLTALRIEGNLECQLSSWLDLHVAGETQGLRNQDLQSPLLLSINIIWSCLATHNQKLLKNTPQRSTVGHGGNYFISVWLGDFPRTTLILLSKQLLVMSLEMYLLYQPLDHNRNMTFGQWDFGPQAKALQSTGGSSSGEGSSREDTEGSLFMFLYLIPHKLR